MRLVALLLLLGTAVPALAQSGGARPGLLHQWISEPYHDSAARAFAYSAGATLGTLALGAGLYLVLPEGDPTRDTYSPRDAALFVLSMGALAGPAVGNATLGAPDDVVRGVQIKAVGIGAGGALLAMGLFSCLAEQATPDPECDGLGPFALAGVVTLGAGVVAGAAYDLATIPRNAARARARLGDRAPSLSLVPLPRGGALALRVPL